MTLTGDFRFAVADFPLRSALELYGYETGTIVGQSLATLWGNETSEERLKPVLSRARDESVAIEDWHVREDGSVF